LTGPESSVSRVAEFPLTRRDSNRR
jgi:hypothetical protein